MYIVMHRSTKMPMSCWGKYRRVAVVELDGTIEGEPKMISPRARGVRRVVRTWERLNVGSTERCAFERALREAEDYRDELNSREQA